MHNTHKINNRHYQFTQVYYVSKTLSPYEKKSIKLTFYCCKINIQQVIKIVRAL